MNIRNTTKEDIPEVLEIYEHARSFMKKTGNPDQWKDSYPEQEIIEQDINNNVSYVIVGDDGEIQGTFMFFVGTDSTYDVIKNGSWLNDEPYGVIHRIAGNGVKHGILREAVSFCRNKCGNIRIDTHKDNKVMQNALEKLGFIRCGIIYLENGEPRIAYHLSETSNDKTGIETLNSDIIKIN